MPPVPKVALASPRRVQPWPDERRLLVAGHAAQHRRPGQGGRRSQHARGVDDLGQHGHGNAQARRAPWRSSGRRRARGARSRRRWSGRSRAGRPPRASRPPRCRRCRSTGRGCASGSARSRSMPSLVADSLGATRMPCARRARQMPTVRRSCQPMPGPTGSPVARSHTTVEARWLAIPTPARPTGARASAAAWRAPPRARRRPWRRRRTRRAREPGRWAGTVPAVDVADRRRPSARPRRARSRCPRRPPGRGHGQGASPNGEGRPSLPGVEDAARVECVLAASAEPKRPHPRPSCHEAGPVQADPVVVADGGAVRCGRLP